MGGGGVREKRGQEKGGPGKGEGGKKDGGGGQLIPIGFGALTKVSHGASLPPPPHKRGERASEDIRRQRIGKETKTPFLAFSGIGWGGVGRAVSDLSMGIIAFFPCCTKGE